MLFISVFCSSFFTFYRDIIPYMPTLERLKAVGEGLFFQVQKDAKYAAAGIHRNESESTNKNRDDNHK
jgi:hypothetical protein